MEDKFERKVAEWLSEEPGTWVGLWFDRLKFLWWNKVPHSFRFFGVLHWIVKFAILASAPAIAFLVYKRITLAEAGFAVAGLFILHTLSSSLDAWSKRRQGGDALTPSEMWVRVGDLVQSVRSDATKAQQRDATIQACLGIIEGYARLITRSPKGRISVSLALYEGSSTTKMQIKHRNPGCERPVGRRLKNIESVLGHRACQQGVEPRVVNDLKLFGPKGFRSPTQAECSYRSICFIPMVSNRNGRNGEIVGFLGRVDEVPDP